MRVYEEKIIESAEYEAVTVSGPVSGACHKCAFCDDHDLCAVHACHGLDFPPGHALRDAGRNIIWITKE